ncbi:Ig-like domain-containing protein [Pseudonocardia sp. WMMC193]|uniref:L,D-transpeptidase n=1 Tax=Pseudonocardia sp. WMMC193 TaxID=2911965 RepID=UPI001F30E5F8|nr:Ig-like domain-containing protein [Pseudonocardia sp. WMMC193]MCF7550041.1 Ig-like domain-containing protein [Pseudonocardia sp. WMMC193]
MILGRREGRKRMRAVLGLVVAVVLGLGVLVGVRSPAVAGVLGSDGLVPVAEPAAPDHAPTPIVHVTPASDLNPTTPITVTVADGTAQAVRVTDPKGKAVEGTLAPDGRTWTSTGELAYATTYAVGVDTLDRDRAPGHTDATVTTIAPKAQAYPSFVPAPNSVPSVGVGQPLVVRFDHPITDRAAAEKALTVTTSPVQVGAWYWISDTEVHYRAAQYWQAGTTITLKAAMFGVDLGDGVYGSTDRTLKLAVHDAWVAKADGATEQMQIFDNGALVKTMNISLGAPGFPSHTGPHVISDKQPSIIMDSCTYGVCAGQPGYYKEKVDLDLRISNDGEFVHSAPWSVGQQGNENVSHGCVNLAPADAQWFFDHFGIGDVVEITNSGGPPLPVYDTYGDWELSWAQWQTGS